jgi:hypothetical protein
MPYIRVETAELRKARRGQWLRCRHLTLIAYTTPGFRIETRIVRCERRLHFGRKHR